MAIAKTKTTPKSKPPSKKLVGKFKEIKEMKTNSAEKYANYLSVYCLSRGFGDRKTDWSNIMALSPPTSVLNLIIEHMREKSDFPHQIAFFGVLHFLAGHLLSHEIHIDWHGQKVYPDIWSIILAPSGSGKSSVESFLNKLFSEFDIAKVEPFSTAKSYLNNLSATPKGLLIKDEFAQLLLGMEKQTYLMELKDYFLTTYDNGRIVRATDKGTIEVNEPAISIYGSTVDSTFSTYISQEMLQDGFAQRFNYVYCETRSDKKALLTINQDIDHIKDAFRKSLENIHHRKYFLSDEAEAKYKELYHINVKMFPGIPYSFFRRTQWKGIKYALLYHVLLNKTSEQIDAEDIIWADRITFSHLIDLNKMLSVYDNSDFSKLIDDVIKLKAKFDDDGRVLKANLVPSYLKNRVKNTNEARLLLDIVSDIEAEREKNKQIIADLEKHPPRKD
jgi:hypothetical protein